MTVREGQHVGEARQTVNTYTKVSIIEEVFRVYTDSFNSMFKITFKKDFGVIM